LEAKLGAHLLTFCYRLSIIVCHLGEDRWIFLKDIFNYGEAKLKKKKR